jgi:hypothetical protein
LARPGAARAVLRSALPILAASALASVVQAVLPVRTPLAGTSPSFMSYGIGVVPLGATLSAQPAGGAAVYVVPSGARVALGGRVAIPSGLIPTSAYWAAVTDGGEPIYGFLPARDVEIVAGDPPRLDLAGVRIEAMLSPANAIQAGAALGAPVPPAAGDALAVPGELSIAWLPDSVRRWEPLFLAAGARHGVDPALLAIIALVESGGNSTVYSPVGATGLMQVMPGTGRDIARQRGIAGFEPDRLLDAETNVDFGAWYLAQQLRAFGRADDPDWAESVALAAAAYNGGPGRVSSFLRGGSLPAESARYREYVSGMWRERGDATSPTLERWLAAGGAHLVARAAETPGPGLGDA